MRKLTQQEAEQKSLDVGIKMIGKYLSAKINTEFECPYCAGQKVLIGFNDLRTTHLELCKEWDYKNNLKGPENYSKGTHKKVFWICNKCGRQWKTSVINRTKIKSGCPRCKESKGEKTISKILDKYNIKYKKEKRFNDCRNKKPLPFDFYLPKYNILIEYQGRQHYDIFFKNWSNISLIFKKIINRDKIKRKYCKNNNIKLIEIKYTEFNNIENILKKELNL